MPYREVVKKSLSGFRKALLVFGCYEILLSSAICHKTQRQRAENRRIRRGLGHNLRTNNKRHISVTSKRHRIQIPFAV